MMTNLLNGAHVANKLFSTIARLRLLLVMFLTLTVSANVWGAEVTFNISDYASANNWTNGTAYSSANINIHLTATKGGTGDNGKYYTSNSSWRFYEANDGSITISTNSGTLQSITFTYSKGNNGVLKYNNNGISSGAACSVSGTSATFTVSHSSGTKNGNVQITSITITYTPAASCDKKVSLTKGDETNGTFTLDKANGTYETCDAQLVITLSNITPSAGYQFSEITQSGINSGVTIDQANKTVTYARNTSGESTINVTFEQKQSATITLSEAGVETGVTGKYVGDSYTLPSTTSQSCGTKTLVGWSTVQVAETDAKPTSNYYELGEQVTLAASQTFYAVFATKETSGSGTAGWNEVTSTSDLEAGATYAISNAATAGTYLSTYANGNNFPGSESVICPLILGGSADAWTFQINDGSTYDKRYLTATNTTSNNYLKAVASVDEYSYFSVSFSNGAAVITCTGKDSRNILRKNSSSSLFACYSSGQSAVYLQKYSTGTTTTYSDYTTSCSTQPSRCLTPKCGDDSGGTWLVVSEW